MGVNPLNTNNAQLIKKEVDHIADVNIQRAEAAYNKNHNSEISLTSLQDPTPQKSKFKFLGREFDKPSMSDMLGEQDLTPKIVENTGNKRFDITSHVHPEHQTNVFRHKTIEVSDNPNKFGSSLKNFFNKNNNIADVA